MSVGLQRKKKLLLLSVCHKLIGFSLDHLAKK